MSFAKTAGLTAGFLAAFGLGVAVGPMFVDSDRRTPEVTVATPTAEAEPKPVPAPQPARAKRDAKAAAAPARTAVVVPPASDPALHQRLKPVLNRGANMEKAADGFRNAEEFAMVAHAARNTQLPFMVLKHRVVDQKMSLDAAIRESKPEADASAEVARAKASAREDVKALKS